MDKFDLHQVNNSNENKNKNENSHNKPIDIQEKIDSSTLRTYQWIIFILGFFVILTDGLNTGVIGYIAPSLTQEWMIEKSSLGTVLSAALAGMVIGALVAGPMADKFGRKWIVILTTAFFSVWTIASAFVPSLAYLVVLRFLTGLGLGAAMPNIATLVSEYMPKRIRSLMVNLMFCGFPLGMALGGVLSVQIISDHGWRSMLIVCGVIPLILTCLLFFILPESLQYLVHKNRQQQARAIMSKIFQQAFSSQDVFQLPQTDKQQKSSAVGLIVSKNYIVGTIMLWLSCFMTLLVFYLLSSWMPILLRDAGFSPEQSSLLTAIFPFGGIAGTIIIGVLMDRFGANKVLMLGSLISAVLMVLTGLAHANVVIFSIFIFLSGAGVVGAQSSLPALTALYYPVQGRAAGVSWMHGIGRMGAIFGAFFGAQIFRLNLSLSTVFIVLAIPILLSTLALFIKGYIKKTV